MRYYDYIQYLRACVYIYKFKPLKILSLDPQFQASVVNLRFKFFGLGKNQNEVTNMIKNNRAKKICCYDYRLLFQGYLQ